MTTEPEARSWRQTMSEQFEAREFRTPAGRWYLTLATTDEANPAEQFLSEDKAKQIADILNRPIPMAAPIEISSRPNVTDSVFRRMKVIPWPSATPLATAEERRMAQAIVDSDAVLRVYTATEWDCLNDDGKEWVAVIVREAQATARTMFDAGFLACWADAFMQAGQKPPFEISDAALDRAWEIHLATREPAHSADCASFRIASPGPCDCGYPQAR